MRFFFFHCIILRPDGEVKLKLNSLKTQRRKGAYESMATIGYLAMILRVCWIVERLFIDLYNL